MGIALFITAIVFVLIGLAVIGNKADAERVEADDAKAKFLVANPAIPESALPPKGLPVDAILRHGEWYRRVYGFDSKCCGHPQYGHYYIKMVKTDSGWKDGQHSAQMFPLEAFDDRKEGKHDCLEHQQGRVAYTKKHPDGVIGLHGNYCYVCGKDIPRSDFVARAVPEAGEKV